MKPTLRTGVAGLGVVLGSACASLSGLSGSSGGDAGDAGKGVDATSAKDGHVDAVDAKHTDGGVDAAGCVPGSVRCEGDQPQNCSTGGAWQSDPSACSGDTPVCLDGKCIGCTAGTTRCSGADAGLDASNLVQSCSDAGSWVTTATCAEPSPACVPSEAGASCTCLAGDAGVCSGVCVDEQTDPANCGACGKACGAGATCQTGNCACPSGDVTCDAGCVNEQTDPHNCGQCGVACPTGGACLDAGCACPAASTNCNGACVDTQSDSANCGSCGTLCAGTCQTGRCLVNLATSQSRPTEIAIDATNVYWTTLFGGTVAKVPIVGGDITTIASTPQPVGIAVDSQWVYWAGYQAGTVSKASVSGGTGAPVTTIASMQGSPAGVAVGGGVLYWSDSAGSDQGFIRMADTATDTVGTFTDSVSSLSVAVDDKYVYWANYSEPQELVSEPIGGGTPVTLIKSGLADPAGIAVGGGYVYVTDATLGVVLAAPIGVTGGTTITVASGLMMPAGIAVDATNVYFTEANTGAIWSAPLATSGKAAPIITVANGEPAGIAVDATSLYWADAGHGVITKMTPK